MTRLALLALTTAALGAAAYLVFVSLYKLDGDASPLLETGIYACLFAPLLAASRGQSGAARYHRLKLGALVCFTFWLLHSFAQIVAFDRIPGIVLDPKLLDTSAAAALIAPLLGIPPLALLSATRVVDLSKKLNISLVTFALLFAAFEIYARATEQPLATGRVGEPWYYETPGGVPRYGLKPDHEFVYAFPSNPRGYFHTGNTVTHTINSGGYRGPLRTLAKPDDVFRIAILGDSYAFGWGVHDADTAGAQLERALQADSTGKKIEVLTFAAPGYTSRDELDALRAQALPYSPDLVIIWYAINDVAGDWVPSLQRAGLEQRLAEKAWYLALSKGADRVVQLAQQSVIKRRYKRKQLAEYTHDGPEWRKIKEALRDIQTVATESGTRVCLAIEPMLVNLGRGHYGYAAAHRAIAEFCAEQDMGCYDLYEPIAGQRASDLVVHPSDIHSNEIAKRAFVKFLIPRMRGDKLLP